MTQMETHSLRIEKTLKAPLATVRDALTNPEMLAKWFAPGPMHAIVHACDPVVGGQYEIAMTGPDMEGNEATHTCIGEFTELTATRVAMTFNWTEEPLPNATHMSFDLSETSDGTLLVLTHEGFPTKEAADLHTDGWEGCLARLIEVI